MELKDYVQEVAEFQGNYNNISTDDDEPSFSHEGCDIQHPGSRLGCDIYTTIGYLPITNSVGEIGNVCSECMLFINNGELPSFVTDWRG